MPDPDPLTQLMLKVVWAGFLAGILSGAIIGLFFHREDWMGGYQSYRRRLTRLGHISFFGLGFVNLGFVLTHHLAPLPPFWARLAAAGFITGAITMPAFCFLSAWKKPFRHGFFIPVGAVLLGILCTLIAG